MSEPTANLAAFFDACIERSRRDVALYWRAGERWKEVPYVELGDRARAVARGLRASGVEPGDRVLLLSGTCLEWTVAAWAVSYVGAVLVPVSPLTPKEEVKAIAAVIKPSFILAEDPDVYQRLEGAWGTGHRGVAVFRRDCVVRDVGMEGRPFLRLEDMEGGRVMDVNQLARWGAFQRGRGAESLPGLDCVESDPAIIVHTPGTSGEPKGVVLSHGALLYSIRTLSHVLPVGPEDVQLLFLPLSYVLGLVSLLASHASGTPAALGNGVRSLLEDLRDIRPTYMVGVPRVYEKIVEKIDSIAGEFGFLAKEGYRRGLVAGRQATRLREEGKRPDLETRVVLDVARRSVFQRFRDLFGGRMRFVISGGAPLSQDVGLTLEALGIPVLEGFGLTETSGATHINRLEYRRIGSVGAPLPLVDARVAPDGEILVKSPGLMTEYFGDPEGTTAVFEDGWFHTGDIGVIEGGGILRITGRKKNVIVTATGENVVPARMEGALEQIPVVSRAVVVGDLHSYLVALLTLNERAVDRWATDRGLEEAPVADLRTHPDLYQMIEKEIQRINPDFAPHERVRRFAILDRDFAQEQGELTEDLKVRRSVVLERFSDLIDMLYEDRI